MKTYFTADPHLGHNRVLEMCARPFANIEEHNDAIIRNINNLVGVRDRLFILGDFCWGNEESWVKAIKCKNMHLIAGNHDKAKLGKFFKTAAEVLEIKLKEYKIFLSHYPHAYWPSSHYGSLHLYGHVHSQREETLNRAFPDRRSMDCGVDNAKILLGEYRPFTEDEIINILTARPGHDPVEFYRKQDKKSS